MVETGRSRQAKFYGVTNPILLPDHSGVRYYDTAALDGGHLLVMLNNEYFVLHTKSDDEGKKLIEQWRRDYEGLKGTDWRNDTEQALPDNFSNNLFRS